MVEQGSKVSPPSRGRVLNEGETSMIGEGMGGDKWPTGYRCSGDAETSSSRKSVATYRSERRGRRRIRKREIDDL